MKALLFLALLGFTGLAVAAAALHAWAALALASTVCACLYLACCKAAARPMPRKPYDPTERL